MKSSKKGRLELDKETGATVWTPPEDDKDPEEIGEQHKVFWENFKPLAEAKARPGKKEKLFKETSPEDVASAALDRREERNISHYSGGRFRY